ncbi:MAG TPA: LuxR C-terminal-related transcriptional regulator, partial [Candidatus Dormibacteraeota bacterium]|nr:LuxR C-terminal-related transcriptional regulator [Candidatus Dormibacteraeota bacterium]
GRARLATLTGPGGVGKTRLALELARRHVGQRADGVWLVDLTAAPEPDKVAGEAARALGLRTPSGATPSGTLLQFLARRDVLLVLDNCEHVIQSCAELAGSLLGGCPGLRILATSREPLGVNGETVWRLEPLQPSDAHRLFVERARQHDPRFIPDPQADAAIAAVCARVDHLPLAIELAAAGMTMMAPAELLTNLGSHLRQVGGRGSRLSPARHRTVRATVEWSYELLEADEQRGFRQLGVFVAGFDAEAAAAVAGLQLGPLGRLIDKSLVAAARSADGHTRFRLLETMREFALELLGDAAELAPARQSHMRYYAELLGPFEARWPSSRMQSILDARADDYENIRAAVEWAAAENPCAARALLASAKDFFLMLGPVDGRRLTERLLEDCAARDRERIALQIVLGVVANLAGDAETSCQSLGEAVRLSAELGDDLLQGWANFFLGLTETVWQREIEAARTHLEAARAIHGRIGVGHGWARATAVLALTFLREGDPARARQLVEEALAVDMAEEDDWGLGHCHLYLGVIAESEKAEAIAAGHFREAVIRLRRFRGGPLLPAALIGQAGALAKTDALRAVRVIAAAYALRDRAGAEFTPFFRDRAERIREAAEATAGDAYRLAWADGSHLGLDDAVALALGGGAPRRVSTDGMSIRELEVARLVAEGLTNKQIGARLHVSVRTVESHVRNALTKAGLTNRTQLATWARERAQ